jgi:hypothetical protein
MKAPEKTTQIAVSHFAKPTTGARDPEGRSLMRRITHSLVVVATTAVMGLIAAALPLVALASNGGPGA